MPLFPTMADLVHTSVWMGATLLAVAFLLGVWWLLDSAADRAAKRRWMRREQKEQALADALDAISEASQPRPWTTPAAKGIASRRPLETVARADDRTSQDFWPGAA